MKTICKELTTYLLDGKYMLILDGKAIMNTDYMEPQSGIILVGAGKYILLFDTEAEMLAYIETNKLIALAV